MSLRSRARHRYVFSFLRKRAARQASATSTQTPLLTFVEPVARPPGRVFPFLSARAARLAGPAIRRPVAPTAPPQTAVPAPPPAPAQPLPADAPAQRELPLTEPPAPVTPEAPPPAPVSEAPAPVDWLARMRDGLSRTREKLQDSFSALFQGGAIDEDALEELETILLTADVGMEVTETIVERIRERAGSGADLRALLRSELLQLLQPCQQPLVTARASDGPYVILVVGVNGVGKTTTIGKLAHRLKKEGKSVLLAAGDTFRAAAVEQLQVWGERNEVPVVAQQTGADSAAVIFDAIESGRARNVDVVIADTAGRLHNKDHLMDELAKVVRVIGKADATAPHEVLLVLDAGTGQNALSQASTFQQAVQVSGIAMTKLDGTARGGILFAVAGQLKIPIRFIGIGEQAEDLRPFEAEPFVDALLG